MGLTASINETKKKQQIGVDRVDEVFIAACLKLHFNYISFGKIISFDFILCYCGS